MYVFLIKETVATKKFCSKLAHTHCASMAVVWIHPSPLHLRTYNPAQEIDQ